MSNSEILQRPWWLPNGHFETFHTVTRKKPEVRYQKRIVRTPDNDPIVVDSIRGRSECPMVVIFHGLEGCSQSHSVRVVAKGFSEMKWSVVIPHFRGCGGIVNERPRLYHAADSDVEWMLRYAESVYPHTGIYAVGVSLGGSALLHHLAKREPPLPRAAVTVSTPFALAPCVRAIDGILRRHFYARHFLRTIKRKIYIKAKRYPAICDMKRLGRCSTIGGFDELITAPLHGFENAQHYWQEASSLDLLPTLDIPVLAINALNDPIIHPDTLPPTDINPGTVSFLRPKHGGHCGFWGKPEDWLFSSVRQFFSRHPEPTPSPE